MSVNHNRIKVADLETNQPNKILKTNVKGELEFSDANNQTENYNALDCISQGKTLDARQGKVLKDMIDNNTINLATDQETQITSPVTEDKKVVSRSKLLNWWNWIKSSETLDAVTKRGSISNRYICVNGTSQNPVAFFLMRGGTIIAAIEDVGLKSQLQLTISNPNGYEKSCNMIEVNPASLSSALILLPITNNKDVKTLAVKGDFLTTPAGTESTPALIIPNGKLTSTSQNGAIERDGNGLLWETHNGVRSQIMTKETISSTYSSDIYIPTLDNILNTTGATLINANYTKIGNIVNVMIALTATPKSLALDTEIGISLPFNRSLTTILPAGTSVGSTVNTSFSAQVYLTGSSSASIKYKANTSGFSTIVANFSYAIN